MVGRYVRLLFPQSTHATSRDHANGLAWPRPQQQYRVERKEPQPFYTPEYGYAHLAPVVTFRLTTPALNSGASIPPEHLLPLDMPVYHARSIAVHLGSMPLSETTTSDVVLKKGEVAKRQSEAAEKKLLRSGYLDEKRVAFPGDSDGFELNWLGNTPFMQAQIDPCFTQSFEPSTSGRGPRTEPNVSRALTLHVKLSEQSFLSGFNGKTHLKIEVLFNGQLSNCSLIHTADIRSGAKSLHQVFAGSRVDFLAERPWVLLPPFTTADGGTRRFHKTSTPMERWEEVSAAVLKEAEERGTDKHGEPSHSAAFLQALASMEMPECVKTMQKPGGRRFGVVDVVITAGFGNKIVTGANYLKRPQRLGDSDYAVRTEIKSDEEVAVVKPDGAQDTTDRLLEETRPEDTRNKADARESCTLDDRSHKRQRLSSVGGLSQHSTIQRPFQSPFLRGQIPVLPPPFRHSFGNSLSTNLGMVSSRCPSPEYHSDGHKQPLPANDSNHTYNTTCEINNTQGTKSDACLSFQGYHSPPPEADVHAIQAGAVKYAVPGLPLLERIDTHGSIGGPPFVGSPSVSSPVSQTFGYHTSPPPQHIFSDQMDALNSPTRLGPSIIFVPPTALMLSTPFNWSVPPRALDSAYYQPNDFEEQSRPGSYSYPPTCMPYVRPNGLPGLLLETPPLYGHSGPTQLTAPVILSSPLPQPCGPLPPTAMFSVPSKPRRCSSPEKTAVTSNPNASRATVLVSRLIIAGRNGKPIVDHVWRLPQRIFVNTMNGGRALLVDRGKMAALEHGKIHEQISLPDESSQAGSRAVLLNGKSQSESSAQHVTEVRRDIVIEPAIELPLPYLKRHQGPTNRDIPTNSKIDVPDKIAPFVPARVLAAATPTLVPTPVRKPRSASPTHPTVLQQRTFSRSSLPSIQGPKAATFLLDDPEEVLREAARMRRSKSPTKPAVTPSVLPIAPTARVEPTTDRETHDESSPLSSAPSSPVSEKPVDIVTTADAAPDRIPQLDGSSQRKPAATSPRKLQTPSPTKLSFTAPKLQRPGPSISHPSVSQTSKKRKDPHQSPTRLPRSPGRLKTVDNPLLNHDCVIAFAESVDKTEEKGVLRQVKGERQGKFREEYVALAVRFFVPGG